MYNIDIVQLQFKKVEVLQHNKMNLVSLVAS